MRLLLTALNCPKGEVTTNLARHHELLEQGAAAGCDLVLLPEMSLTGYLHQAAITLADPSVAELVEATEGRPALCFGLVEESAPGQSPYITQVLAADGQVAAVHRKAGLGEGEHEHFVPGDPSDRLTLAGVPVSLAVCAEIGTEPPYQLESTLVLAPAAQACTATGVAPKRTGAAVLTGGAAASSTTPAACSALTNGSRYRPRPVPPSMRTSPAGRRSSGLEA